jgi:hypothetical protein
MTDYRKIITIEQGKRGGKPCIRGMRITVYDVLSYLASRMSVEEVLQDFPYLTRGIFAPVSVIPKMTGNGGFVVIAHTKKR